MSVAAAEATSVAKDVWAVKGEGQLTAFQYILTSSYRRLKGSVINVISRQVPARSQATRKLTLLCCLLCFGPLLLLNHPVLASLSASSLLFADFIMFPCLHSNASLAFHSLVCLFTVALLCLNSYFLFLAFPFIFLLYFLASCTILSPPLLYPSLIRTAKQYPSGGQHIIYKVHQRPS